MKGRRVQRLQLLNPRNGLLDRLVDSQQELHMAFIRHNALLLLRGRSRLGTGLQSNVASLALDVRGKVKFSRSGRATVAKNHSTVTVKLDGVTTASRVFAVLFSNRSGRYVRAAVPGAGSFKIYLNASVSSTTYVSWFVLN